MKVEIHPILFDRGPISGYELRLVEMHHGNKKQKPHTVDVADVRGTYRVFSVTRVRHKSTEGHNWFQFNSSIPRYCVLFYSAVVLPVIWASILIFYLKAPIQFPFSLVAFFLVFVCNLLHRFLIPSHIYQSFMIENIFKNYNCGTYITQIAFVIPMIFHIFMDQWKWNPHLKYEWNSFNQKNIIK